MYTLRTRRRHIGETSATIRKDDPGATAKTRVPQGSAEAERPGSTAGVGKNSEPLSSISLRAWLDFAEQS